MDVERLYDLYITHPKRGKRGIKRNKKRRHDKTDRTCHPSKPPVYQIREKETRYNTVSLMQIRFDPWHLTARGKKQNIVDDEFLHPKFRKGTPRRRQMGIRRSFALAEMPNFAKP